MGKKKLVILTGAGVSAESGLKTFRDGDGLWEGHRVEDVATPRAWARNPQLVLDFYNERRKNVTAAVPNAAHYGFAELQNYFEVYIITQNIDDLHERAGSSRVLHLHGEIFKMRSVADPFSFYDIHGDIRLGDMAPDGTQFRPHVVWFEEPVPMIEQAVPIVQHADIFVIAGTSLVVYPAAGLVNYTRFGIPRFAIDKKIGYDIDPEFLIPIEMPATEGVQELVSMLKSKHL